MLGSRKSFARESNTICGNIEWRNGQRREFASANRKGIQHDKALIDRVLIAKELLYDSAVPRRVNLLYLRRNNGNLRSCFLRTTGDDRIEGTLSFDAEAIQIIIVHKSDQPVREIDGILLYKCDRHQYRLVLPSKRTYQALGHNRVSCV